MSHINTTRKTCYLKGGIEVRITQRTEASRLIAIIPKSVGKSDETIKRKNKYLSMELEKKGTITHEVSVKVRVPYKFDSMGIIKEEPITVKVDDENFIGIVTIFPKFYLSEATKKINEKKKDELCVAIPHDTKYFKPSSSKYDKYTHSNVARPYRG